VQTLGTKTKDKNSTLLPQARAHPALQEERFPQIFFVPKQNGLCIIHSRYNPQIMASTPATAPVPAEDITRQIPISDRVKFTAAVCPIAAYIFGLLVTNYYLYRIGESDFWTFRVKFIYTGAIALVVPTLFLLSFLNFRRDRSFIIASLLSCIGLGMVFYYPWIYNESHGIAVRGMLYLGSGSIFMAFAVFRGIRLFRQTQSRLPHAVLCLLVFWIACANYIQAYADHIYPYMGDVFGGGKGRYVQLWIASDERIPGTLALPMVDSAMSQNVMLALERDDYFVVCTGKEFQTRVLRVRKSLVKAIQIVPPPQAVPPCWAEPPKSF
jgi:hypothetical protein